MQARCQKWASVESWRPEYTLIFCASASPPVHRTAITSRSPLLIISIVIAALQHLRVAEALRVALLPRAAPHDLHLGVGVGRGGGGCAHFFGDDRGSRRWRNTVTHTGGSNAASQRLESKAKKSAAHPPGGSWLGWRRSARSSTSRGCRPCCAPLSAGDARVAPRWNTFRSRARSSSRTQRLSRSRYGARSPAYPPRQLHAPQP